MSWDDYCQPCGGTGEKFDKEKDDWTAPIENCPECKGTGLAKEPIPLLELPGSERLAQNRNRCKKCGRQKGCDEKCEDMNCEHCYCYREGRDG